MKMIGENIAKTLVEKEGVRCRCGKELIYRGRAEYWCDDIRCTDLYVIDQDCHIVRNGMISKCKETRCLL